MPVANMPVATSHSMCH